MSDISMCKGMVSGQESDEVKQCPIREQCYRFTAPANPYRQAFFIESPGYFEGEFEFKCDYSWDNEDRKVK